LPAGVQADHQVEPVTADETLRTLASAKQTLMPPESGVEAKRGLQGVDESDGCT
jgi:hypothetical protein